MVVGYAKNGLPVLVYRSKFLHSSIDPLRESDSFIKEYHYFFESLNEHPKLIVVAGIGLGYFLYRILKDGYYTPHLRVLSIETELSESTFFEKYAMDEIKYNISVQFFNPLKSLQLQKFQQLIAGYRYDNILWKIDFNKIRILKEFYHTPIQIVQNAIQQKMFNVLTDSFFGRRWWMNFIHNFIENSLDSYTISKISKPILMIGSGYSSFENLSWIYKIQNSCLLICVLPIVELLLLNNIIPDIVFITDGGEANKYYRVITKLNAFPQVKVFCYFHIFVSLLRWYKGNISFFNSGLEIEQELTPEFMTIPSAGSVASSILSFALQYQTDIYHIGFDFCYFRYHPHFPGSILEQQSIYTSNRYMTMESSITSKICTSEYYFNNYPTSLSMQSYAQDFFSKIQYALKQDKTVRPLSKTLNIDDNDFNFCQKETIYEKRTLILQNEKKNRLLQLYYKMLDLAKKQEYDHSLINLIMSRAILKKQDLKICLDQNIKWLESYLTILN